MPKYLYPYILSYEGKILYIGFAMMVLNQVVQYHITLSQYRKLICIREPQKIRLGIAVK